jgi:hypothetical protein
MMLARIEQARRLRSADVRMSEVRACPKSWSRPPLKPANTAGWQAGFSRLSETERIVALAKRPWTEADNERLKNFVAQGLSIVRAAAFRRTTKSVRIQARKIGTPFPPMRVFRKKFALFRSVSGVRRSYRFRQARRPISQAAVLNLRSFRRNIIGSTGLVV